MISKKINGMPHMAHGTSFIWPDEVRFSMKRYSCSTCGDDVRGYKVPFRRPVICKTVFCSICDEILEKPEDWGKWAPGNIPVDVKLKDGEVLVQHTHDYIPRDNSLNNVEVFHCGDNLMQFISKWDKTDYVEEGHFECSNCLVERRYKAFKN